MGRYASTPEVEETEYAFVISRTLDPDDEFAEKQVLCRAPGSNGLEWAEWVCAYGPSILEWQKRPQAQQTLRVLLFGIEEGIDEARRRLY